MNNGRCDLISLKKWVLVLLLFAVFIELSHFALIGSFRNAIMSRSLTMTVAFLWVLMPNVFAALFMLIANQIGISKSTFVYLLVSGCGLLSALIYFDKLMLSDVFGYGILAILFPITVFSVIKVIGGLFKGSSDNEKYYSITYINVLALTILLSVITNATLSITRVIFPFTYDYYLYAIDGAFPSVANSAVILNRELPSFVNDITFFVYAAMSVVTLPMVAMFARESKMETFNAWRSFLIPFAIAPLCYAWIHASGPIYAFSDNFFPHSMPLASEAPLTMALIPPSYRNAMPSMHLTGAVILWMFSVALNWRGWIFIYTVFGLITAWATLALGEHYVIDLIVALPFASTLGVLLMCPAEYWRKGKWQKIGIIFSMMSFASWMLLIRWFPEWLVDNKNYVRIASAFNVIIFGYVLYNFYGIVGQMKKNIYKKVGDEDVLT